MGFGDSATASLPTCFREKHEARTRLASTSLRSPSVHHLSVCCQSACSLSQRHRRRRLRRCCRATTNSSRRPGYAACLPDTTGEVVVSTTSVMRRPTPGVHAPPRPEPSSLCRGDSSRVTETPNNQAAVRFAVPVAKRAVSDDSAAPTDRTDNTARTGFPSTPQRTKNDSGAERRVVERAWDTYRVDKGSGVLSLCFVGVAKRGCISCQLRRWSTCSAARRAFVVRGGGRGGAEPRREEARNGVQCWCRADDERFLVLFGARV
ncbi:hypothetical protein IWX90DRAFT_201489 [Phyllosticta citrichinensis]|uniref:Uncharacterized protein n=1 Tax=Phyllosticta citrichinensis TaxID=1130410 RepID=A0ABR1XXS1_9PEZI